MQSPAVKKDTWPESVVVWVSTGAVVVWLPLQQIKNSTQPESGRRLGGGWAAVGLGSLDGYRKVSLQSFVRLSFYFFCCMRFGAAVKMPARRRPCFNAPVSVCVKYFLS